MNRLVIIGNGFDLAHGLKTKYEDFIDWYWVNRMKGLEHEESLVSKDPLCTLTNALNKSWSVSYSEDRNLQRTKKSTKIIRNLKDKPYYYKLEMTELFSVICENIQAKGWVDIENDYYSCLTRAVINYKEFGKDFLDGLNRDFAYIRELLIAYLSQENQKKIELIDSINEKIYKSILKDEMPINNPDYPYNSIPDEITPSRIMLLNFNYTNTPQLYLKADAKISINYIHGSLESPQSIIFGYGDESDKEYNRLKEFEDSECLHYIKQLHYLKYGNYRKLRAFIETDPFQICIMGHSCGTSDRSLLKMLFEHHNCLSIKLYYYLMKNGEDDYDLRIQSINKCFSNLQMMQDKVVVKEFTEPLT